MCTAGQGGPDLAGGFAVQPAGQPDPAGAGHLGQAETPTGVGAFLDPGQHRHLPAFGLPGSDHLEQPLPPHTELARPERRGLTEQVLLPDRPMLHRQIGDRAGDHPHLLHGDHTTGQRRRAPR